LRKGGGVVRRVARASRGLHKSSARKHLDDTGPQIETSPSASEKWFRELYAPYQHKADKFNQPYGVFIPDVYNKPFMYIIEVDGSIHDLSAVKEKDLRKQSYFERKHWRVFRVKHGDQQAFDSLIKDLTEYREHRCKIRPRLRPK
jgi:very-short-patch-repair endonuclease